MADTISRETVGSEFAELVCSDPELLRAEFDAIVSAAFPVPPPARRRPPRPGVPWPKPAPTVRQFSAVGPPDVPVLPGTTGQRQRSPPGW